MRKLFQTIKKHLPKIKAWVGNTYHQSSLWLERQVPVLLHRLENIGKDKHEYKGTFSSESKYLSYRFTGVIATGKAIKRDLAYMHTLINGGSGSGKSTKSAVKSILHLAESKNDKPVSLVILDPSQELYGLTSGYVSKTHRIIPVNFSNAKESADYNLLHRLKKSDISGIQKLSTQLVTIKTTKGNTGSPFWDQSAIELLTFMIALTLEQDKKCQHIYQVGTFLEKFQNKSMGRSEISALVKKANNPWLTQKYASIIGNDERTLDSIISSTRVAITQFMLDEQVKQICSNDSVGDFQNLRKEPIAIYIHSSITNANFYSKVISIFISDLMNSLFSKLPSENDQSVFFILDEFATLRLDKDLISLLFANARKYLLSFTTYTQDALSQLTNIYGPEVAKSILANIKTKVFYSISEEMARSLERTFGQYSYVDKDDNNRKKSRSLLTVDEMIHFAPYTLVCIEGVRPIKTIAIPFYQEPKILVKTKIPPFIYNHENKDKKVHLVDTKAILEQQNLIKIPKYGE